MKKIFAVVISLFCLAAVFAEDWYVCLGSFTKKEYLDTYIAALDKNNIPSFTQPYTDKNGVNYTRVFYDEPFSKPETARMVRDSLQPKKVFKDFKMDGLWICQTSKPAPVVKEVSAPAEVIEEKTPEVVEVPVKEVPAPLVKEVPVKEIPAPVAKEVPAPVTVETPAPKTVPSVSYSYEEVIAWAPYISGFDPVSVEIYNIDGINRYDTEIDYEHALTFEEVDGISDFAVLVRYENAESAVNVNICLNNDQYPEYEGTDLFPDDAIKVVESAFRGTPVKGWLAPSENCTYFAGFSKDYKIFFTYNTEGLELSDACNLISKMDFKKGLNGYEKCVAALPSIDPAEENDFLFTSAKPTESNDDFVVENPEWALLCLRDWHSENEFVYDEEVYQVLAVNVHSFTSAQVVFDMYLTEKFLDGESATSHKEDYGYSSGWYEEDGETKKASLVIGSNLLFVETTASKEALLDFADAL